MRKRILISLALLILAVRAEDNLQRQFNYAKELFDSGSYFDAITEFKRLQFFDSENVYKFESDYHIGISYKKGGYYQNAIEYFTKAKLSTTDFDKISELKFQIIRTNILRKTTTRALQLLGELENDSLYSSQINTINYWRGWAYMTSDNWSEAAQYFAAISPEHELKLRCEQVENDKYSVTFARVISYILPGAGQFYTGNFFSGFMSLAWNALWGYLTINAFIDQRAFDGAAIGSLLWLRFYRGNVQNAGKLAEIENIKIANNALSFIMENYRGEKP